MQSGKIKNRAITASSSFNHFHSAWLSRLHRVKRGRHIGAWASKYRNYNQWLQVDLGYAMKITGIATQGRQDANQWVTVYRVYFSTDGVYFALVKYWWNAVKVTGVNWGTISNTSKDCCQGVWRLLIIFLMFGPRVLLIRAMIIGKRCQCKRISHDHDLQFKFVCFFGSNSKETMTDIQSVLMLSGPLCSPDTFASIHEDGTVGCLWDWNYTVAGGVSNSVSFIKICKIIDFSSQFGATHGTLEESWPMSIFVKIDLFSDYFKQTSYLPTLPLRTPLRKVCLVLVILYRKIPKISPSMYKPLQI